MNQFTSAKFGGMRRLRALAGTVLMLCTAAAAQPAQQSEFVTIDFPGSIDSRAVGINPAGDIVGRYLDTSGHSHGFLLSDGRYQSIDFPGSIFTGLNGINPQGIL